MSSRHQPVNIVVKKGCRWTLHSSYFGKRAFASQADALNAAADAAKQSGKNGNPGLVTLQKGQKLKTILTT